MGYGGAMRVSRVVGVVALLAACEAGGGSADGDGTGTETGAGTGTDTGSATDTDSHTETASDTDADTDTDTDGGIDGAGPDFAPDPSVDGPFPVGVQTIALMDTVRGRPVTVEVWYPATDAALDGEPVVYTIEDLLRPDARDLLETEVEAELATRAVRDVPLRESDGPYPVVLFSHGSGGVRIQSTYFTVPLASHGYVVVAPDHHGNTLSDVLLAGDLETEDLLESIPQRTTDLDFLVEWLATEPLGPGVNPARLGVAGHSLGALTSLRWVGLGGPAEALVAQAPPTMEVTWLGVNTPLAEVDAAVMLQVGGMDLTTPPEDADTVWIEAAPPRARLTLANAGHFTFSDLCLIDAAAIAEAANLGLVDALDDGCAPENTDPEVAATTLRHFGIGQFNVYLRDSTPTLDLLTQSIGRDLAGPELTYESDL